MLNNINCCNYSMYLCITNLYTAICNCKYKLNFVQVGKIYLNKKCINLSHNVGNNLGSINKFNQTG